MIDIQSHNGDPIVLEKANDLYGYYKHAQALAQTINVCMTPLVVGVYGRRWRERKSVATALSRRRRLRCLESKVARRSV